MINQPAFKHKFEGIGETGAALVLAGLATNPTFSWAAVGTVGRITWFIAKLVVMGLASLGLVVLNVGAEKIETLQAESGFDGSWESAQRLIAAIKSQGRELTDEEKRKIDEPVKNAFRRFARIGRVRKR